MNYIVSVNFINKEKHSKQFKLKVFKTNYRPILILGENHGYLVKVRNQDAGGCGDQGCEIGVTKQDRVRKADLRTELGIHPTLNRKRRKRV